MREIKFQGKRVDNGEWVYGSLIQMDDEGHQAFIFPPYNRASSRTCGHLVALGMIAVIPETVGQYTGLKDRHGVEIYEGDVLRNVDNPLVDKLPFKVVWNEYYGAWFWWSTLGEFGTDHLYQSIASDFEVIGNIHDNPELMGDERTTIERLEELKEWFHIVAERVVSSFHVENCYLIDHLIEAEIDRQRLLLDADKQLIGGEEWPVKP